VSLHSTTLYTFSPTVQLSLRALGRVLDCSESSTTLVRGVKGAHATVLELNIIRWTQIIATFAHFVL
jgi:hypothetical protein